MQHFCLGFILAIFLFSSCGNSSTIGADLLDDEKIDIKYNDDFQLSSRTIPGETLIFNMSGNYAGYLVGQVEDPLYGSYGSDISFSYYPISSVVSVLDSAALDSVVLVMAYDSSGFAGDTMIQTEFVLKSLEESMPEEDTISTNRTLATSTMSLGSTTIASKPKTSVKYLNPSLDSVVTTVPQLRIKLSEAFSDKLFSDTLMLKNDTLFKKNYLGFNLSMTGTPNRLVSFNTRHPESRMIMYYKDKKGKSKRFDFKIRTKVFQHISQDLSNSQVSEYIDAPAEKKDLVFVQGLQGTDISVKMPDLSSYKDVLINYAYFDMIYSEDKNDILPSPSFTPSSQLFMSVKDAEGNFEYIEDISKQGVVSLSSGFDYHGGTLKVIEEDGKKISRVRFVVTDYIKKLIKGNTSDECIIRPRLRTQRGTNSVFYGAEHSTYPMKLKIAYTNN